MANRKKGRGAQRVAFRSRDYFKLERYENLPLNTFLCINPQAFLNLQQPLYSHQNTKSEIICPLSAKNVKEIDKKGHDGILNPGRDICKNVHKALKESINQKTPVAGVS